MKYLAEPRCWWQAAPPTEHLLPIEHPAKYVFYTYTGGIYGYTNTSLQKELLRLQAIQVKKGAADIIYNFLIGGNGQVFEGRGWHACPKLASRYYNVSQKSIYIAFMGIFKGTIPPRKMVKNGDWLVKLGVQRGFIDPYFLEIRRTGCGLGWEKTAHIRNSWALNKTQSSTI